jgi:hypothetical protein
MTDRKRKLEIFSQMVRHLTALVYLITGWEGIEGLRELTVKFVPPNADALAILEENVVDESAYDTLLDLMKDSGYKFRFTLEAMKK